MDDTLSELNNLLSAGADSHRHQSLFPVVAERMLSLGDDATKNMLRDSLLQIYAQAASLESVPDKPFHKASSALRKLSDNCDNLGARFKSYFYRGSSPRKVKRNDDGKFQSVLVAENLDEKDHDYYTAELNDAELLQFRFHSAMNLADELVAAPHKPLLRVDSLDQYLIECGGGALSGSIIGFLAGGADSDNRYRFFAEAALGEDVNRIAVAATAAAILGAAGGIGKAIYIHKTNTANAEIRDEQFQIIEDYDFSLSKT